MKRTAMEKLVAWKSSDERMVRFCLNNIGRKGYFGQTDTLLAVLEKYRQRLYKSILKVRVNG